MKLHKLQVYRTKTTDQQLSGAQRAVAKFTKLIVKRQRSEYFKCTAQEKIDITG